MNGAAYVLDALRREGITHVFMVPGGLNDAFMPAMTSTDGVTPIVCAHEGGAAYMADGYSRASGRFGAAFGIGGPGMTNMVTALAAAYVDQSRVLVVGGEVPTDWEGRGGFQDASAEGLNDREILRPVTGQSIAVEHPSLLDHHLRTAITGLVARQRPVHLSIPTNVQTAAVTHTWQPLHDELFSHHAVDAAAVRRFWALFDGEDTTTTLAVLAGAGAVKSNAGADLVAFAERFEVPVATTLRAKGVFPEDHPLSLGVFGYAGTRHADEGLCRDDLDVLLVLGSGLNQRDTLYWNRRMLPRRALVQVDDDLSAIGRTWPVDVAVTGDVAAVVRNLAAAPDADTAGLAAGRTARREWLADVTNAGPRLYEPENTRSDAVPLHPARVVAELRAATRRDGILCVDSGAHRAWCGHYWDSYEAHTYLSLTNLGPMGGAIPMAIGAKLARPDRSVAVVTSDGCMLMHGMEVHTAVRHGVAVVFVVLNNRSYGNIWYRASRMGPEVEALTDIPHGDWAGFARSLGAQATTVTRPDELGPAFSAAYASGGPFLVDVHTDKTYATPVTPWKQAAQEWEDDQ